MALEPIWEIEYDAEGVPVRMWWRGFRPSWKDQVMTWREQAAPIIAKVIAETESKDLHLLKQRLREAFPWGDYGSNYWPVRIWRSEIQRQLHPEKKPIKHGGRKPEPVPAEQGRLL
jgi:hypothetical protein